MEQILSESLSWLSDYVFLLFVFLFRSSVLSAVLLSDSVVQCTYVVTEMIEYRELQSHLAL